MRFLTYFLLSVFTISTVSTLFGVDIAKAASAYDNAYHTTDILQVRNADTSPTCTTQDITSNYTDYILDDSKWVTGAPYDSYRENAQTSFLNAIDHGRWGVSQTKNTLSPNADYVTVFWTENTSLSLDWYTSGVYFNSAYSLRIECSNINSQQPFVSATSYSGANLTLHSGLMSYDPSASAFTDVYNYFIYSDNLNIPVGYDGEDIRQTPPLPPVQPDFGYSVQPNGDLTVIYLKNLPNTAIQWHYELYEADSSFVKGDLINEQTLGISVVYEFSLPAIGNYILEVNDTVIIPAPPPDPEIIDMSFQIVHNGTFHSGGTGLDECTDGVCTVTTMDFEECITDGFPYVNVPNCLSNVTKFIGLLSFKTVQLNDSWLIPTGCHELSVLNDWLGLGEGNTICPVFPQYIRTAVTPFVTVVFGLIVMRYLVRPHRSNF